MELTNDTEEYSSKRGCIMDKENRVVCPSLGFIFKMFKTKRIIKND